MVKAFPACTVAALGLAASAVWGPSNTPSPTQNARTANESRRQLRPDMRSYPRREVQQAAITYAAPNKATLADRNNM